MEVPDLLTRAKSILQAHYGDRMEGLILYGSEARGEATEESDIDLMVLLKEPFSTFEEISCITHVLYPLQLESERWISAIPGSADAVARGAIQLYRNILEDGVPV